ncbi:bifunctional methylenetetrahydrofolate dehydrogenase/methenyltetrahydrofolate cyclohydrolase FolD [candidate division KSB1 bacterium]|nr:bifunctional methylenetetrahydrofolate dehydrogenase/methenyltetrahydrofolate cyclohydrolase FolD [candidate division KSB1 bacterium]
MAARIIDGKKIAEEIKLELLQRITFLQNKGVTPGLAVVLVGDDPASAVYVNAKAKMCETLGLLSQVHRRAEQTSETELLELLARLNHDPHIHGILVQAPLPKHIDEQRVFEHVAPEKDVDGFHPFSRGRLQLGEEAFVPCTPAGIQELLVRSGSPVQGKHVVILGRSPIVGLPLALLFLQKNNAANATVTVCHSATQDLSQHTKRADVLIAAIGRPKFVTAEMVKDGAVVIDVGINRSDDAASSKGYRLVGDVDFEAVRHKAAAITPVPGGVGPMTIIMLMRNTVFAAERFTLRQ